jgi:lipoprotein-anchoring transpeptidase ErfK/SrfK
VRPRAGSAALVGAAALALLPGCGGDDQPTRTGAEEPGAPAPRLATPADTVPQGTISVPGEGAITAWVHQGATLRTQPDGGRAIARVKPKTEFGSATVLPVVERRPAWLAVRSEQAGNNVVAWIPAAAVSQYRIPWRIDVDISDRVLIAHRGEKEVMRVGVAVGTAATPTPTGSYFVTDRLRDGRPGSPYGCCILALSAHQPHLKQGWGGGDRIAIHATPNQGSIGRAASNGCLRVRTDEMRVLLRRIPIGTPVAIKD